MFGSRRRGTMFQNLANSDIPTRLWLEVFRVYNQDYQYVKGGVLKFPWDALIRGEGESKSESSSSNTLLLPQLNFNHRQANPIFAITETVGTIRESVAIFSRRNNDQQQQSTTKKQSIFMDDSSTSSGEVVYPDYYLNDFHFQTDA